MNETLKINIDNYSGPLEVLLDLAKQQKVDLTSISITQLADQFIDFINSAKKINLDLASEYLLMATWLTYLKSKLLLPEDEEEFVQTNDEDMETDPSNENAKDEIADSSTEEDGVR